MYVCLVHSSQQLHGHLSTQKKCHAPSHPTSCWARTMPIWGTVRGVEEEIRQSQMTFASAAETALLRWRFVVNRFLWRQRRGERIPEILNQSQLEREVVKSCNYVQLLPLNCLEAPRCRELMTNSVSAMSLELIFNFTPPSWRHLRFYDFKNAVLKLFVFLLFS